MSTIAKSFTATGVGTNLSVMHGDSFTYSVSGTFVGTVILEKTLDGGQTFSTVATATTSASGTVLVETPNRQAASFRFRCSAYTSGTIVTSIADAVSLVREFKDASGNTVLTINEDGISVPGNITVTGNTVSPSITSSLALASIEASLTAHAGGTQATALALDSTKIVHQISTVGTTADSIALPLATGSGKCHVVRNDGANSMQVFGSGTDTINGVATATGVAQAAGKCAMYFDYGSGKYISLLGA